MATENIVVEISAKGTQELQSTLDALVKMGTITAQDAEAFRKLSAETKNLTTETQKATEAVKAGAAATTQASTTKQAALDKEIARLKELQELSKKAADPVSAQKFTQAIKESEASIKKLNVELVKSQVPVRSLRTLYAEAKNEVNRLADASGGKLTPELLKAAKAAAAIKDRISDLNKTLDSLNPEAKLTAFVQIGVGISGAFTAAQGAMALFGNESEDVQKALLKVQAALAITQGLNSVLQLGDAFKNLKAVLGITTAATALNTTVTAGASTAQGALAVATNFTTAAFNRLKIAIASNPLGAIATVLATVLAATILYDQANDDLTDSIEDGTDALAEYNAELEHRKKLEEGRAQVITQVRNDIIKGIEREIALLEAVNTNGQKDNDIIKKKIELIKEQQSLIDRLRERSDSGQLSPEQAAAAFELETQRLVLELKLKNIKKGGEEEQKIRDQIFQNQLRANELLAKNDLDLLQRKLHNLELLEERELKAAEGNELKKLEIILRFANQRKELETEIANFVITQNKRVVDAFEKELNDLNTSRKSQSDASQAEVDQNLQNIFAKELEAEKRLQELIGFTAQLGAELSGLIFNIIENSNRAAIESLEEQKRVRLQAFDEELEQLEELNQNKIISDGVYTQRVKELNKQREQAEIQANKKIADEKRKAFIAQRIASIAQAAINIAEGITKAIAQTGVLSPFVIPAIAALGAIQIATILATPIPKFKKGVIGLEGAGTETSDSIPALLSRGESVMTAAETRKFEPTLLSIRKGLISPEILNSVAVNHQFGKVEAFMDTHKLTKANRKIIPQQADAIGRATAYYLSENNYYSPLRQ